MNTTNYLVELDEVKSMKEMIESCYTYGGIGKDSYNYERYILPYSEKIGKDKFDKVYKEHCEYLQDFEVEHNVFTDSEGVTYNKLVSKQK